mgnify:CR=1 FL=1
MLNCCRGVPVRLALFHRTIQNRNVMDFVSEAYVVHHVMQTRQMDHETYRKIQNDIDHVVR